MSASSEKQLLQSMLDAFDENSKSNKHYAFHKKFIFVGLILFSIATAVTYKFGLFEEITRLLLALVTGFCLAGFGVIQLWQDSAKILKPYIDLQSIEERLNEIET